VQNAIFLVVALPVIATYNLSPTESYAGQSSYQASADAINSSNNNINSNNLESYPGIGHFGSLMNLQNPPIQSSYTTYGNNGNNFGSTSYINYPSSNHLTMSDIGSRNIHGIDWQSLFAQNMMHQAANEAAISQHIEYTKPIAVPIYKKFPFAVEKQFPIAIPHAVLVPVPAPFPGVLFYTIEWVIINIVLIFYHYFIVNVHVSQPVAYPVMKELKVPVEKEIPYAVEKKVPVKVDKPVGYNVEKHYPIYNSKPYPVKVSLNGDL